MTAKAISEQIIHLRLECGRRVCIRTVEQDDEERLRAGIEQLSPRSRYLRFMSAASTPPDWIIDRLIDVDGTSHLAWGAIDMDQKGKPAIGVVHAIRSERSGEMDYSVAVLDHYHEEGVATLLTAVLLIECNAAGIQTLHAQTVAENRPAVQFLASLGGSHKETRQAVSEFELEVESAIDCLRRENSPPGLKTIFREMEHFL